MMCKQSKNTQKQTSNELSRTIVSVYYCFERLERLQNREVDRTHMPSQDQTPIATHHSVFEGLTQSEQLRQHIQWYNH